MARLKGKVALITGASQGQGWAHARRFCAEGARVVIADIQDEKGTRLAADLGKAAYYVHLDVSAESDWSRAIEDAIGHFGRLDVLINNAGVVEVSPIAEMELASYLRVAMVNEVGCFLGMRAVIAPMQVTGGGSIINVSSTAGLQGVPGVAAYSASKHAIRGLTRTASLELGSLAIRVNSVCPGGVDAPQLHQKEFAAVDRDAFLENQAIHRWCSPDEVSSLMVFLASDDSLYCTGADFLIDGGAMAGRPIPGFAPTTAGGPK